MNRKIIENFWSFTAKCDECDKYYVIKKYLFSHKHCALIILITIIVCWNIGCILVFGCIMVKKKIMKDSRNIGFNHSICLREVIF